MNIKEAHHHLICHNIKPSMQRVAIMQYLMENKTHPTIDEIFNDLLPKVPTLSKTTVYNTLKLFGEKKAVLSLTIDEKNLRYDAETSAHAHFKCKRCGSICDVSLENTKIPVFEGDKTFFLEETHVYFLGTCEKCRK
ncbi:MAG: transcriptional repressor [Bacteroidales bacterium]|jgi:Fur family ferric uptake transcriptional regulator/Fur family peroxide stress response transcriptional regulator|nr:transcriptional repressor [Bacteroidales bacterium]